MEGDTDPAAEGLQALGRALRQARQAKKLSRPQLARLIPRSDTERDGISEKTIQRWEEGDLTDLKRVRQAEDALGLAPWSLLNEAGLFASDEAAAPTEDQLAAIHEELRALRAKLEAGPDAARPSPRRSRAQGS